MFEHKSQSEITSAIDLPLHPVAMAVPPMSEEDFAFFEQSVLEAGVINEPVKVVDGQIIDGRHRQQVAKKHGLALPFVVLDTDAAGAAALAIAANLARRNLTPSQRAIAVVELKQMLKGGVNDRAMPTTDELAAEAGVSDRMVQHAKNVISQGTPELVSEVKKGKVSVSTGAKAAKRPKEDQEAVVEEAQKGKGKGKKKLEELERSERNSIDINGNVIPKRLIQIKEDTAAISACLKTLQGLKGLLSDMAEFTYRSKGVIAKTHIDQLASVIKACKQVKFGCCCTECLGKGTVDGKKCMACDGTGWWTVGEMSSNGKAKEVGEQP